MKSFYTTFSSAVLSGICISIASICYLRTGGVAGAVLFGFGLLAVVHYGWKLYTGTCGFVESRRDHLWLAVILAGNIAGCFFTAQLARYAQPELVDSATAAVDKRVSMGLWRCLINAVGCGFIMTVAVKFARQSKFLPLLFGVPVFILCGFLHSIADAFYFSMAEGAKWCSESLSMLSTYLVIVAGNYIGCNLVRIITLDKKG